MNELEQDLLCARAVVADARKRAAACLIARRFDEADELLREAAQVEMLTDCVARMRVRLQD